MGRLLKCLNIDKTQNRKHIDDKDLDSAQKLKAETSEVSSNTGKETQQQPTWAHHAEFFFSTLGGCVGFGNLWRFPYLCMRNGGGAFLIPYVIFLVICAIPLAYMESIVGQFSGRGYMRLWDICPLFKGVGHLTTLICLIWLLYAPVFIAWSLHFLCSSFASNVPWATCGNWWNTPACWDFSKSTNYNSTVFNISSAIQPNKSSFGISSFQNASVIEDLPSYAVKRTTPAEEYFENKVLRITDGIQNVGSVQWELFGCLIGAWILTILCVIKGIRTSGKVAYVTGGAPYILLLVLLVRGVTLPGAIEGIKFYLIPDFRRLADIKVWGEACVQVFYSFCVCFGYYTPLTSYNKFNNNCLRDAILIPTLSGSTSILAGMVVFSAMGFMAGQFGVGITEVTKAGPSLAFIAYPEALRQLPIAPLWSILFFLTMILLGIDSAFVIIECVVTSLADDYPIVKKHKSIATLSLGAVMFLLGIVFVTEGGMYVLTFIDWYSFLFTPLLIGVCECAALGWIYGPTKLNDHMKAMLGRSPASMWWTICWRFITPATLLFMIIFNAITLSPVMYGKHKFPGYVTVMGVLFSVGQLFLLPIFMVYKLWAAPNASLSQKFRFLLKPSSKWGKRQIDSELDLKTADIELVTVTDR